MINGWVCPVCGEANSPYQNACVAGPHRRTIESISTNGPDWRCTCGTSAVCVVHQPPPNTITVQVVTQENDDE